MTSKENAKELVNNVGKIIGKELKNGGFKYNIEIPKLCALIAVDEILNIDSIKPYILHKEIIEFYEEVKKEIEKL
jgi:hypothetical protein